MTNGLHHIAVICSDKARSLKFYGLLGFNVIGEKLRPERNDEIVFMEQNGIVLELFIEKGRPARVTDPEAYGLRHIAFQADNIEEILTLMRKENFETEEIRTDTVNGKKMAFIKDPDDLPVELHE